jgi:hypothetical protein
MTSPPAYSASVNCQEISSARIIPSSMTRLVLAISNTIAEVKLAPLRSSDRASATAAYEHEDDAAPRPVARVSVLGLSSPSMRVIVCRRTRAWTIADRANPSMSDQVISQAMVPATAKAWPRASRTCIIRR